MVFHLIILLVQEARGLKASNFNFSALQQLSASDVDNLYDNRNATDSKIDNKHGRITANSWGIHVRHYDKDGNPKSDYAIGWVLAFALFVILGVLVGLDGIYNQFTITKNLMHLIAQAIGYKYSLNKEL